MTFFAPLVDTALNLLVTRAILVKQPSDIEEQRCDEDDAHGLGCLRPHASLSVQTVN